jgi:type II secretory pathway component GspD/PulD (secretin)
MRRFEIAFLTLSVVSSWYGGTALAQVLEAPQLERLSVPAKEARSLATKLNIRYRDVQGVHVSPDARDGQLVIMAPVSTQRKIANDVQEMLSSSGKPVSDGPLRWQLKQITWREFEQCLQQIEGGRLSRSNTLGNRVTYQLASTPLGGTSVEIDRQNSAIVVNGSQTTLVGVQSLMEALDRPTRSSSHVTEIVKLENAEPAPIQRALRLLSDLRLQDAVMVTPNNGGTFRRAVFQQGAETGNNRQGRGDVAPSEPLPEATPEAGTGVIGDTDIQFVPELGIIIIKGAKKDVERVRSVIAQIEQQAEITQPAIEVVPLKHADSNAISSLLQQLYEDVLSSRQGEVSITALDSPNALLLIGREEALVALKDLIEKIDLPIDENSRLRVFRLQHASATDAATTIREFFADRPGGSDDVRPGLGIRVRVSADIRTNSLIINASPRDMEEVTRLINDIDVQQIAATDELKVFSLNNALAADLAPILQSAINGTSEGSSAVEDISTPSKALQIVAIDAEGNRVLDSGVLSGAVITADPNSNAVIVRAPAASMALIGELIRQLDTAPGADSYVKVFTIENGDALKLTTTLQELFGDSGTTGGAVGGANLTGLSSASASGENSLVALRFTTDQRTNSIIASGSADDLDVVESILLRLDSEGFAERITEVVWLKHQYAPDIATAIQAYIAQRTQGVQRIQQFQQGLGPLDLPDRDLIVVAEPTSNSLLISVAPRLYEEVRRLIDKLDRRPPMVLIKVVIAEVSLRDLLEVGGELGLQDSLLYDRGIAAGAIASGNPPSTDPTARPGFNFNNAGLPNANSFGKEKAAGRGVTSLGVGATSAAVPGAAGFVLSAASESVSVLFRSLQNANRLQIISRPQIMTVDNTTGYVQVGQQIARPSDININQNTTSIGVNELNVGLILEVTPRVGSDGLIIMNVRATRSAVNLTDPGQAIGVFQDGTPVTVPPIDRTEAQSTLTAYSNQTVVFGGLIQKTRSNTSRRVPYLSSIPVLGYFFKFDSENEVRSELLVVMTPMIVTGDEDLEYVKATESSRMSYCLADVIEAHGDVGLQPGYGLWGPAVGPTIYPDLQPTVDHMTTPADGQGLPVGSTILSDEPVGTRIIESVPVPAETTQPLDSGLLLDSPRDRRTAPQDPVETKAVSYDSPAKGNDPLVKGKTVAKTAEWRTQSAPRTPGAPAPKKLPVPTPSKSAPSTQTKQADLSRASVRQPASTSQVKK